MLNCGAIICSITVTRQVNIFVKKKIQEKHRKHRHRHSPLFAFSISSNAPSNTRLIPFLLLISSNSSREVLLKLQPVKSSLSVLSPFSVSFSAMTWMNLATASSVRTDLLRSSLLREENILANCSPVWSSIACREF